MVYFCVEATGSCLSHQHPLPVHGFAGSEGQDSRGHRRAHCFCFLVERVGHEQVAENDNAPMSLHGRLGEVIHTMG
jgi:hypothetical protein